MIRNIVLGVILLGAVAVGFYDSARGASSFSLPQWNNSQPQGQGGGQGQGQGQGTPVEHTWITLNGTVVAFDGQQTLTVDTTERGRLDLWLGRVGFAGQQGITFTAGDTVTVLGFDAPNGQFQAGEITNSTTGQTLYLRDPNGRPLWAGQGQGQG